MRGVRVNHGGGRNLPRPLPIGFASHGWRIAEKAKCGVSDDDMLLDWELTALASTNVGFAHEMRYDRLVAGFLNYPGSTTAERVAAFVKEQGFTDDDIKRLKAFLLE